MWTQKCSSWEKTWKSDDSPLIEWFYASFTTLLQIPSQWSSMFVHKLLMAIQLDSNVNVLYGKAMLFDIFLCNTKLFYVIFWGSIKLHWKFTMKLVDPIYHKENTKLESKKTKVTDRKFIEHHSAVSSCDAKKSTSF